jgi:coenzyme F420-0:L-glutamate ligase/coenzyme F420-1:gamma-L-glutamate ligase
LPAYPDASARVISKKILAAAGVHVGVIITDSDGRIEKTGATQVAIGAYGVPPLRKTESRGQDGSMSAARFAEISMSC